MLTSSARWFCPRIAIGLVILTLISAASAQVPELEPPAPTPAANTLPAAQAGAPKVDVQQPVAGDGSATQEPNASDQAGMFVFKKDVEEVILHATVVDDQRRLVSDLGRDAFAVFENGTPQTITAGGERHAPGPLWSRPWCYCPLPPQTI
jgi:hypothetical protein